MDLATWLFAQYDVDEEAARACPPLTDWWASGVEGSTASGMAQLFVERFDPAWVLAECAAKRAIVERHLTCERENALYSADYQAYEAWCEAANLDGEDPETSAAFRRVHPKPLPRTTTPFETDGLRMAVQLLAQAYVDREGYDPAWAPSS